MDNIIELNVYKKLCIIKLVLINSEYIIYNIIVV